MNDAMRAAYGPGRAPRSDRAGALNPDAPEDVAGSRSGAKRTALGRAVRGPCWPHGPRDVRGEASLRRTRQPAWGEANRRIKPTVTKVSGSVGSNYASRRSRRRGAQHSPHCLNDAMRAAHGPGRASPSAGAGALNPNDPNNGCGARSGAKRTAFGRAVRGPCWSHGPRDGLDASSRRRTGTRPTAKPAARSNQR